MNIVYLSPHFPPNYYLFSVNLKKMGARVLGIGDASYDELRTELKDALTEYYRVENMEDYEQVLRACGYFTHAYGKIDHVESHNEYWLETEARLRTDFNIQGTKNHQVARITRKSEMKNLFQKAGVEVARGKIVKNIESARNLIQETGYPVVCKPDRGVGAADTFMINNDEELNAFFSGNRQNRYIMEEFINGDIHSFDGLTDLDGNVVFYTSHVFSQGIMETVNQDRDIFYYSMCEIPQDIEEAGINTVKAFHIRGKFFHIEFFRTRDNKLTALEMNARPPGGLTTDMFNFANNIDVYKEWANIVVLNKFTASYSRPYHCGYIGRKLNKNYINSHRAIMQNFGHIIVYHGHIDSVFSAAIGNYAYLANSACLEDLKKAAEFIQATA
ncbi:ATP-grasp domain-containing protein [Desulfonema limicola]|uniref:ATP-grasp domain-containing protein n=1 Tax=Desulfonema limicola TaxID=45656 RepID=A0A975GHP2_9BACT|nr:ATP-grasp domain-containing protein [Desulfonema limicola]QTA81627.1 ATP-grasp domain-containing protein [Desulfonema limicola]